MRSRGVLTLHVGLAVVSAVLILAEILAMRQWKLGLGMEAAHVMIPVALMGNALGSAIAFFVGRRWPAGGLAAMLVGAVLFALLAPTQFVLLGLYGFADVSAVGSRIRFEGEAWRLLVESGALAVATFTASGFVTTMSFQVLPERTVTLYVAVMLGSAAGAIATVPLMDGLGSAGAVTVMACAGLLPVALFYVVAAPPWPRLAVLGVLLAAVGAGACVWLPEMATVHVYRGPVSFRGSNSISQIEAWPSTKKRIGRDNSDRRSPDKQEARLFRVAVDERSTSTRIVVYDDLHDVTALHHDVGSILYLLRNPQDVLIVGSGGGMDVLQALLGGAAEVTALEFNGVTVAATRAVGSHVYDEPRVRVHVEDGRRFVRQRPDRRWDLVLLPHVKGYGSAGFSYAIVKDYVLTAQALWLFATRLGPRGVIAVRDADSTFLWHLDTLLHALKGHVTLDPRHFLRIDGSHDVIVAWSPFPFSDDELAQLRGRIPRDFDVSRISAEVLEERGDSELATVDDWPFILRLRSSDYDEDAVPMNVLIASYRGTAWYLLGIGLALCAIPWAFARPARGQRLVAALLVIWFLLIGAAFVLVELALIDIVTPLVGHPMISTCVVIATLLVAAGVGSLRLASAPIAACPRMALIAIPPAVLSLLAVPPLITHLAFTFTGGLVLCLLVTALLLAIPGFFMGAMFPNGLRLAASESPLWAPWMWTANGVGAVLGGLPFRGLSYALGFRGCLWTGAAAYLVAGLCMLAIGWSLRWRCRGDAAGPTPGT